MTEHVSDEQDTGGNGRLPRRAFLGGVAAGSLLLAGCAESDTPTEGGGTTPAETADVPTEETTEREETAERFERGEWRAHGPTRQVEGLDRGVVAVPTDGGVLVRWRLFGTESPDTGFVVYRDGDPLTDEPITGSTNYLDADGTTDASYAVAAVVDGSEGDRSGAVETWDRAYKRIPVEKPEPTTGEDGRDVTYHANDASAADLTGNGSYDLVLKWTPSNAKDNSQPGPTSSVYLDGYTLSGEQLWRIDLGRNIRAGAHYTPFQVYDYDGDGIAEVAVRTSDGTTDAAGTVVGDPDADHADDEGYVIEGPEFLTVFDGETGEALDTVNFEPARGDICSWGDCWGNRADRFLAGTAYLDGRRPSIVWGRGYYEKTMVAAYDFRDGSLSKRWVFDSTDGNRAYEGQGNHQLSVADVDNDGHDEIVYGAMVLDHDGTGLYSTGWGHGDALHVGDFDPRRGGLEVFQIHEGADIPHQATFRDAETGSLRWSQRTGRDTGRGMIADIDPESAGMEAWSNSGAGLTAIDGAELSATIPDSINFGIWWTGDLQRELLDHEWYGRYGVGKIERWDAQAEQLQTLLSFEGTRSNNWTKGTPCLQADLLGDWREEVLWRETDSEALRLYATPQKTDHRLYTLMHDTRYRLAIAAQNAGYNQPPWPSFYVGERMPEPPQPDIEPATDPKR